MQLGRFGVGTLGEVLMMFTASVGVVHLYHGVCWGRGQAPESLSSYHLDIEKNLTRINMHEILELGDSARVYVRRYNLLREVILW